MLTLSGFAQEKDAVKQAGETPISSVYWGDVIWEKKVVWHYYGTKPEIRPMDRAEEMAIAKREFPELDKMPGFTVYNPNPDPNRNRRVVGFETSCSPSSDKDGNVSKSGEIVIYVPIRDLVKVGLESALSQVNKGEIVSVSNMEMPEGVDVDDIKDQTTEMLLKLGYGVVAKEYLQQLYKEQQQQQTGIYNGETIVQGGNFSATGHYINIKMTKSKLSVQVISVSTGQYEGTASIEYGSKKKNIKL